MDNHIDSDRFSALSHAERAAAGLANGAPHMKRGNSGVLVSPVLADAPGLPVAHHKYGKATGSWAYRDTTGAILFWVLRFDPPGERKQFFPLSLWRVEGRLKWRRQGVPAPRPLYAMDKLAQRLEVSVVICEGEKLADAAAMIFPNSVATCSPNGSGSAKNADWSPLEGRRGIDVGAEGAITLLNTNGALVSVEDMPVLADGPKGRLGAFAFGRSRGVAEGILGSVGIPATFLARAAWKRSVGLSLASKDAARSEAIRRWPTHAALFARVKDDGRAEAALIAVAGLMRIGGA
jgi:hypothetical protein